MKIKSLIKNCSICVNLIGILYKNNQFQTIHTDLPNMLSKISSEFNIDKFIHLSSLGAEKAEHSRYAKSKLDGEQKVLNNFKIL